MLTPKEPRPVDGAEPEPVAPASRTADGEEVRDASQLMAYGAAIGVIGLGGALISGAVCPVCVVAAPALLGAGIVKRLRARRVT